MFGVDRPYQKTLPISGNSKMLPEDMQLVAREDIFSNHGGRAVLLIRAGMVVGEELLPKLIRYGAEPDQFVLKNIRKKGFSRNADQKKPDERSMTIPVGDRNGKNITHNKIVVFESDARSLKRIVDTLVLSGVYLGDIHPVRQADNLEAALARYQPNLIFIDQTFHPESSLFSRLKALKSTYGIENVVMTAQVPKQHALVRDELIARAERAGVHVIFKPVNPFALVPYLERYKTKKAVNRSMKFQGSID